MSEDSDIEVEISKNDMDLWTVDLSIDGMDIPLAILNTFNSLDFFAESILLLLSLLQL